MSSKPDEYRAPRLAGWLLDGSARSVAIAPTYAFPDRPLPGYRIGSHAQGEALESALRTVLETPGMIKGGDEARALLEPNNG